MEDFWVDNNGVRLHCLTNSVSNELLPIVFVPGMLGRAESYQSEMEALAVHPSLVISLRGRGQSDAPVSDYTFDDYIGDIEAVINASGWDRIYLSGFSASVALVVGYASRHPERVAGLLLGDSIPVNKKIPASWVDQVSGYFPDYDVDVLRAMQAESEEVVLWDQLVNIQCPVLLMKGGAEGSMLSAENLDRYRELLAEVEVVIFPEAGHELWKPTPDLYWQTIKDFLGHGYQ